MGEVGDMHRYFALYVGVVPIPVGWFFKENEARIWATQNYPSCTAIEIRPFEFRWGLTSFDQRDRPTAFFVRHES